MSETMEHASDTGNGVLAADSIAAPATVENSTPSPAARRGSRRTGNAQKLTVIERLEILQQALVDLKPHGILVQAIHHPDRQMAVLALSGVGYCQYCHRLRLWEEMVGDRCQYCAAEG